MYKLFLSFILVTADLLLKRLSKRLLYQETSVTTQAYIALK